MQMDIALQKEHVFVNPGGWDLFAKLVGQSFQFTNQIQLIVYNLVIARDTENV